MSQKKGPTKAQLQKTVDRLQKQLSELTRPDRLRHEGEHWYEVVEYFDAAEIRRIPLNKGRAFILGKLADFVVVEIGRDVEQQEVVRLACHLDEHGIKPLIVTEAIRFLRLATVAAEVETKLDAAHGGNNSEAAGSPDATVDVSPARP